MVGWFDPGQLVRTGVDVVISAIFARNSDRRVLDALSHPKADPADYSSRAELWLDYVADTGDGWNSTYAVAHSLAQPVLRCPASRSNHPANQLCSSARGMVVVRSTP